MLDSLERKNGSSDWKWDYLKKIEKMKKAKKLEK